MCTFTKKISVYLFVLFYSTIQSCYALSDEARAKGFVFLHEIDPTIRCSIRYFSNENFVGTNIDGYKRGDTVIITKQAAEALKKVQQEVLADGYSLVIYDAYRPQKAVNHFVRWGKNIKDQIKKADYYPRIDKKTVFKLEYIVTRSGHSRGSTVDLTLIKCSDKLHKINIKERKMLDGTPYKFLDDGTIDMGSSFDLFDCASHHKNNLIASKYKIRRAYLAEKMLKHGFKHYEDEWWHFTLINEPYPANFDSSYFNFDIE
jgi:D-alanyl-D-alanine dipeptidase